MTEKTLVGKITKPQGKENWLYFVAKDGSVMTMPPPVKLSPEEIAKRDAEKKKANEEKKAKNKVAMGKYNAEKSKVIIDLKAARKVARSTLKPEDAQKVQELASKLEGLKLKSWKEYL